MNKSKLKPKPSTITYDFEAIGTQWQVELYGQAAFLEKLKQKIATRIDEFDKNYSRFRSDSLVTRMSLRPGRYELPPDAKPMLDLYYELYKLTGGLVTPLIGQTLADAGYDAAYSLKSKKLTRPPRWEDALEYDSPYLTIKQPTLLDFGAFGKGYLVDIVAKILQADGMQQFLINAGGDMLHYGSDAVEVGLEDPDNAQQAIGVASLHGKSLCGSSGNRRAWSTYHHIINPLSLTSPKEIRALWVCADNTMLADALATCLFFISPEKLLQTYDFSYAIIHDDYSLTRSKDFTATFFTEAEQ